MNRILIGLGLTVALALPVLAQDKEQDRVENDASGNADSLLLALSRIYLLLPNSQRQEFLLRIPQAS